MFQNPSKLPVAAGLLAVCWLVAMPAAAQQPSAPQALPVNVENTASVIVTNTPTVTLSAGASVSVNNPSDGQGNPTPLATLEAVQLYGSTCNMQFNGGDGGFCEFIAVPQGKQLVVQEFDAEGEVEAGNRPYDVRLDNTITSGNYFPYTFLVNSGGLDFLATHQETRLYVSSGESPACAVQLPANSNGSYNCEISGFLVDVPLGQQSITVQHKKPRLFLNHPPAR